MTVPADTPASTVTERLARLRQSARALRQELPEHAAEADAKNIDSGYAMRRYWEEGFLDFHLPVAYGGITDGDPGSHTEVFIDSLVDLVAGDSSAGMSYCVQTVVTLEIFDQDNGLPESTKQEVAHRISGEGLRLVASNSEAGSAQRVVARRVGDGIVLSGVKTFNTNSGGGGMANVGTAMEGEQGWWHALVPLDAKGVTCRHDWDVMGQRGTHSQTIEYDNVFVPDGWYYRTHGFRPAMIPLLFLTHASIMLGAGYGAFDAARDYVLKLDRPTLPEFSSATTDALVRKRIGGFAVDLEAARAYLLQCADRIARWDELGVKEDEIAVEAVAVKVACVRAALEVTQGIFDLTGARSTSNKYRFDRFWRNARTFSTHDSTDAKQVWVGDWYLNGKPLPFAAQLRV